MKSLALRVGFVAALAVIGACSRTDVLDSLPPLESVAVTPANPTVKLGTTVTFTASATPSLTGATFTWSLTPSESASGTISDAGVYTAPATMPASGANVTVTATLNDSGIVYTGTSTVTLSTTAVATGMAVALNIVSGNNQTVTAGQSFGASLVVDAVDANMNPVAGVEVTFMCPGLPPSVGTTSSTIEAQEVTPTAPQQAGSYTCPVSSTTPGVASVSFAFTVVAGPEANMTVGDGQMAGTEGENLSAPAIVTFTDQYGNPVSGASASGVGPAGGNATAVAQASGSNGEQKFTIQLAPVTGMQVFVFTDNNNPNLTATITFTAQSGVAASLIVVSGDMQSGTVGTTLANQLVVQAVDANGLPVANVPLSWVATASTLKNQSTSTGMLGNGTANLLLGTTAGLASVTVTSTAIPGAQVTFAETMAAGPATVLVALSGGGQMGTGGAPYGGAFTVEAKDKYGNPVSGVTVTFSATTGGGSVSPATATTAANGQAQTQMTAGPLGGSQVYTATSGTLSVSVTNSAGGPNSFELTISGGNNQTGAISTALPAQLQVTVTTNGVAVAGQTVTFGVTQGNGKLSSATAVTNAMGVVSVTATLGTVAGTDQFSASLAGAANSPVLFNETATGDAVAQLVIVSGNGQIQVLPAAGTPVPALPQPFVVEAVDANGAPVSGVTIKFAAPMGASVAPTTFVTGSNGQPAGFASVTGTLADVAGVQNFVASDGALTVTFSATASSIPPSYAISIVSGSGQSGSAGTTLGSDLIVKVVNTANNNSPVSGATITWTVVGGGTVQNDQLATQSGTGQASAQLKLATTTGPETVTVTAVGPGGANVANSPVTFIETSVAGAATQLVLVSGDGQTGTAGQLFGGAFSVRATDAHGNPVTGATVDFTVVAGGGSISPSAAMTDATGLAQAKMTAGAAGGTETYEAALVGTSATVTITCTATPPGNYLLTVVSGSGQTGTVNSLLPTPLTVLLTLNGMAVSGKTITFAVSQGSGSVTTPSVTTGANGQASTTATLGSIAGAEVFAASFPSASNSPVFFNETATGDTVALLRIVSGSGQTSNPNTLLAAPLVVQALDANGKPVAGATITWKAPTGGKVSSVTVTTGANGEAQVDGTLGPAAGTQDFIATDGTASVTFTETASAVTTGMKIVVISGQDQTGQDGAALAEPLVVAVENNGGGPISGITVTWKAGAALATVSSGSVTTNSMGLAQVTATLGRTVGAQQFFAACAMCTGSPATFTENATSAPASQLVIVSGDGQSGRPGSTLTGKLVVEAEDPDGNPVSGVVVTFATGVGGGSLSGTTTLTTGANGQVSISAVLGAMAGTDTFVATATGLSSATFTETATAMISSISVSPQNMSLQIGASQDYIATAIYVDGTTGNITSLVTWSVGNVGNITAGPGTAGAGQFKATASGSSEVKATLNGITGETPVIVDAAQLTSIIVTPAGASISAGSKQQMTGTGDYSNGLVSNVTDTCTWTSSNSAVATVSNATGSQGVVTAVSAGTSTISCALSGVTGSRVITVTASPITQLEITPTNVSQSVGGGQLFVATATFADGTVQIVTDSATWSSSDTAQMTLQNAPGGTAGKATFIAAGTPDVVVTYDGMTTKEQVTIIAATVVSLSLNPNNVTLPVGNTQQLTLKATFSNGTVSTVTALASWTTSSASTADVSNATNSAGLVTAIASGNATITATYGGQTATCAVTVNGAMASMFFAVWLPPNFPMMLGPSTVTCNAGETIDLVCGSLEMGGGMGPPMPTYLTTEANWTTSNGSIGVVGNGANGGVLQCLKAGTVTITATWENQSGSADVTVSGNTVTSITVLPSSLTLFGNGSQGLQATANWSDGTTTTITTLGTWTSSDPSIASVSNAAGTEGVVTAVQPGNAVITITYLGQSTKVPVTVSSATISSIVISPADDEVMLQMGGRGGPGGGGRPQIVQMSATAVLTGADGGTSEENITDAVSWSMTNPSNTTVGTISNQAGSQGQVTVSAMGTATINATYGTFTGTTTFTVF